MLDTSAIFSVVAMMIAGLSLAFSFYSWRQANRPLVTVRVSSNGLAGNMAIPLSLVVENTGNRPAKSIRLSVSQRSLKKALVPNANETLHEEIERIFKPETVIPILANGRSLKNSFGITSNDEYATWKPWSLLDITVTYEDVDGRKFSEVNPIQLADDEGFAGGVWNRSITPDLMREGTKD